MNNEKILIVDDEEDLCEILRFNLENEGFSTDIAYSGEDALKKISPLYSLVLLDVMMDGISGFKTAEKIRKELHINIPIIFLTAKYGENNLLTGFSAGGDDYITKPFSIKEVLARIKAVLKRSISAETSLPNITLGALTIDVQEKKALVNDRLLQLTRKEFDILLMLAQAPQRTFSRTEILNNVWKDDSYILERTVDVHITRLRKKIGDSPHIINRPGYGYYIEN